MKPNPYELRELKRLDIRLTAFKQRNWTGDDWLLETIIASAVLALLILIGGISFFYQS